MAYPFQKPMHIAELEEEITTDIYYKESQKLDDSFDSKQSRSQTSQ